MTKTTGYHHGDLRAALLVAALDDLRTRPAHELSIRELAERIGVSKAAPYRHFPSRPEFLAAVRERGFAVFLEALQAAEVAADDPRELLRSLGATYVEFACARPWLYRLLFSAEGYRLPFAEPASAGAACFEVLVRAAQGARTAGWRRDEDPANLAAALWSFVHGLALLRMEGMLEPPSGQESTWWKRLAGILVESTP